MRRENAEKDEAAPEDDENGTATAARDDEMDEMMRER